MNAYTVALVKEDNTEVEIGSSGDWWGMMTVVEDVAHPILSPPSLFKGVVIRINVAEVEDSDHIFTRR